MPDQGFIAGPCPRCGWIATDGDAPRTYSQLGALGAFDAHMADHRAGRLVAEEIAADLAELVAA